MEFGLFRTMWTVRNRVIVWRPSVHIIEVRVCMEFGLFQTKLTVRNREVSVL